MQRERPPRAGERMEVTKGRRRKSRPLNKKLPVPRGARTWRRKKLPVGEGTRKRKAAIGPESGCVTRTRERFPFRKPWRLWTSQRKVSGGGHRRARTINKKRKTSGVDLRTHSTHSF